MARWCDRETEANGSEARAGQAGHVAEVAAVAASAAAGEAPQNRAMTANAAAIGAVMSVAKDLAEGRLSTDDLQAEVAEACRGLVGTVVGPGDELWDLQLEIARGILAARGIPSAELVEWLACARRGDQDDAVQTLVQATDSTETPDATEDD